MDIFTTSIKNTGQKTNSICVIKGNQNKNVADLLQYHPIARTLKTNSVCLHGKKFKILTWNLGWNSVLDSGATTIPSSIDSFDGSN